MSLVSLLSPISQSGPSSSSGITIVGTLVDRRMYSSSNASRPPSRWPPGIPERSRQATASSILRGSSSVRFMAIRNVRAVALGERNRGSTDAAAGRASGDLETSRSFGVSPWPAMTRGLLQSKAPDRQADMADGQSLPFKVNLLRRPRSL